MEDAKEKGKYKRFVHMHMLVAYAKKCQDTAGVQENHLNTKAFF